MNAIFGLLAAVLFSSCSGLMVPGEGSARGGSVEAQAVLGRSVSVMGDGWKRHQKVEVSFDGEWTGVVKRLQPDLVDSEFRKSSEEIYEPRRGVVRQRHQGPGGTKTVLRSPGKVKVVYEGESAKEIDRSVRDAAALVTDAYTAFLFGSSWLREVGRDLVLLESDELGGERCELVQGRLSPGFGFSDEDHFIAWIGRDSGYLKRLQFTIEGLESTRGADVEVSFFDHWKAVDGSIWPGRFVEWVERPVHVKAHEWTMTGLKVDGRRFR